MQHKFYFVWGYVFLLGFSGCTVGPFYQIPSVDVPDEWKSPASEEITNSIGCLDHWWEIFEDPFLNDLEEYAHENNKDIDIAIERVFEARANAQIKGADLYPQVSLRPGVFGAGFLIDFFQPPGLPSMPPYRIVPHEYLLPLTLFYEFDFWGKLKSRRLSAVYDFQAQQMALQTSLLILSTDLAANYFQLRALDSRLELFEKSIKVRKDALEVNRERYRLGLSEFSDVTRAETLLYNADAEYQHLMVQRILKVNKIAVLLGVPASNFTIEKKPLFISPPQIPPYLPSEILKRRPDIYEAERKASAEHALIGEAYASFFPSIELTGALGFASPELSDFLTWKSRLWFFGLSALQPLLDGDRNKRLLDLAYAKFREASANYQQTVLRAFQEVEDQLATLYYQKKEIESLQKAVDAAKMTTELSTARYLNGLVGYIDVTDSEQTELVTHDSLINLLGMQYLATIELIKALGGSWNESSQVMGE